MIMKQLLFLSLLLFVLGCSGNGSSKDGEGSRLKEKKVTRLSYDEYRTEPWYKAYALNQIDSACILIEKRLAKHPRELPTLSAYAEVIFRKRRLDLRSVDRDSALSFRKKMLDSTALILDSVLAIDPNNGHAYKLQGDIFHIKRDMDRAHIVKECARAYKKATEVEPTYGRGWEALFAVSEELGDDSLAKKALTELSKRGFYTSTILKKNELTLASLPKNAIWITNGDLEYFPTKVLQSVFNMRPDVLVLNYSLLNARYHIDYAREKGLFPTVTEEEFEQFVRFKFGRDYKGRAFALVNKLLSDFDQNIHQRPICFVSLPVSSFMKPVLPRLKYRGFIREIQPNGAALDMNADSLALFFRTLKSEDFIEPAVSEQESSPVMLSARYVRKIDFHLIMPALIAVDNFMQQGRVSEAKALIADMKTFLTAVNSNHEHSVKVIKSYEERILKIEAGATSPSKQ